MSEIVRFGKWVPKQMEQSFGLDEEIVSNIINYNCSNCGEPWHGRLSNYCSDCGCKMIIEEENTPECEFCKSANSIYGYFSAEGNYNSTSWAHQYDGDVSYCPMCGRKIW